jgi:two-component system chemotaxis response regulator CheY
VGKAILVIDDENSVGALLRFSLRHKGYSVEVAESAAAGLEKAKGARFDLVILDVALPAIDGVEACQLLKTMPAYAETPVIMISSRSDSVTVDRARRAGAAEYLVKPFTFLQLERTIEDLLSGSFFP